MGVRLSLVVRLGTSSCALRSTSPNAIWLTMLCAPVARNRQPARLPSASMGSIALVGRNCQSARVPSGSTASFSLVLLGAHRIVPGALPCLTGSLLSPPLAHPYLIPASASLPLRRRCGSRRNAARRLLDDVQ